MTKLRKNFNKAKHFLAYMTLFPIICLLFACGQGGINVDSASASMAALVEPVAAGPLTGIPDSPPGSPALAFSDLQNGPKTGWEGSATKGAAVSIWGLGFGSTRGTSYVTVNGAMLVNDADYAEWGATNNNARGLQRITFWLNNTCADGIGAITVTINGKTSNPVPFQVTKGNIYFISKTGSDSNNGKYSTSQGWSNGPWQHFYMANPVKHNLNGGDVIYIRAGNYDDIDHSSAMLQINGPYNNNGPYFNVVGYPGEWPILAQNAVIGYVAYTYAAANPNNWVGYLTFAKFVTYAQTQVFSLNGGHHIRVIGITMRNCNGVAQAGVIGGAPGHDVFIYGNIIRDSGYDAYKHAVYFSAYFGNELQSSTYNIDVGWNEIFNYRSDLGQRIGAALFDFRNAVDPWQCYNIWIHDNLTYDSPQAQFLKLEQKTHDIYIYNNIGYNLNKLGNQSAVGNLGVGSSAPGNTYVYNNTFYDCGSTTGGSGNGSNTNTYFIFQQSFTVAGSNTYSKNNIYYSINGEPLMWFTGAGNFYSDHDDFFGNTMPSASGFVVTNLIVSDPQFVSLSTPDFHLQSTSPAINAGTSDVSPVLNYDYDLISRPQNSAYDIGAYEYHNP